MGTRDLSEGHPWATNVHRTDRVGSAWVSALISPGVLGYILEESSAMVYPEHLQRILEVHWNSSSCGPEGVGRFKAALDSVSAKYMYLPFL